MTATRPPRQSVDSFQDRKWKESLTRQQVVVASIPDVSFVTVSPNAVLNNERALTGSSAITITDTGPNASIIVDLSNTGVTAGSYIKPNLTIDSKGRVTSALPTVTNIAEYDADPALPSTGDVWVLRTTTGGGVGAGSTYGLLAAITNAGAGAASTYQLSFKTAAGGTKRVGLT